MTPRGYCKGVIHALQVVKKTINNYPGEEIHLLGNIIHNRFIKSALEDANVVVHDSIGKTRLELLDEIHSGIVVFSAHGVSDAVREKAKQKGLHAIDVSCEDVLKTQVLIKKHLKQDCTIFYIGKKGHPEAEAMTQLDPDRILLVSSIEDIPTQITGDILITCQTTMSLYDVQDIAETIRKQYPQSRFMEEICKATELRQTAFKNLSVSDVDLVLVVGDPHSNNTYSLAEIAKKRGFKNVNVIESVEDITDLMLSNVNTVAITAGASTPPYIVDGVITYLEEYPNNNKKAIDYTKVL
jgi:(E)-4-hydroxy-3-methyl-but-2-enyl pyrophosphate reductase (IPP and DMAPP forming)